MVLDTVFQVGRNRVNVKLEEKDGRIYFKFPYNKFFKDEVKSMDGARWSPENKCWHIVSNRRNMFRIMYLMGKNPYAQYDADLIDFTPNRPELKEHQLLLARVGLTYKEVIWAAEMGTGKTLAAFEVMEQSGIDYWWWVGPVPALAAYEAEAYKWKLRVKPQVMTYEKLTRTIKNWEPGLPPPRGIIFDESSRLKSWSSQRSELSRHLVESMRKEYKDKGQPIYVIEMTGTPAPKDPTDWYNQAEIAQPGFVREGNIQKFKQRLAIVEMRDNDATGGMYPHMLSWRDDERKCDKCGKFSDHADHDLSWATEDAHSFVPSQNEVAKLFPRLKGLVTIIFKKDVLNYLPDKNYRILRAEPTIEIRNAARILQASARSTIQTLVGLRELSDGFLYTSEITGETVCPTCNGEKVAQIPHYIEDEDADPDYMGDPVISHYETVECFQCGGSGKIAKYSRNSNEVSSGKDILLSEILADHEDDGRLVIYGAFTGSIDRIKKIVTRAGWEYICADGRGWQYSLTCGSSTKQTALKAFQDKDNGRQIAFIGQPGAAGMGLTLTAANEIVYFSNDFNAESRIQSEDRIHRMGMDLNKGATITDLVQLPSDLLIRESLFLKRKLQDMTLGQFHEAMATYETREE